MVITILNGLCEARRKKHFIEFFSAWMTGSSDEKQSAKAEVLEVEKGLWLRMKGCTRNFFRGMGCNIVS